MFEALAPFVHVPVPAVVAGRARLAAFAAAGLPRGDGRCVGRLVFLADVLRRRLERNAVRETAERAVGALNQVQTAVGASRRGIVLHENRAPSRGLEQRAVHVALEVSEPVALMPAREFPSGIRGPAQRRRTQRRHVVETIAAINVHVLRNRPETVRRIDVSLHCRMVVGAPGARAAFDLLHLHAQVVNVGPFAVSQVPEQAAADHVEYHHLVTAVAHVLEHHAVHAGLLGDFHHLPHFVYRRRQRHFDQGVLAGLHRLHGHGFVPAPGRGDDDGIDIVPFEQAAIGIVPAGVVSGFGLTGFRDGIARIGQRHRIGIAHGPHGCAVHAEQQAQMGHAPGARADQSHANRVESGRHKIDHRAGAGRPGFIRRSGRSPRQ